MSKGVLERVVQHSTAHVEEGRHGCPVPAHLLLLVHALGDDLVDRALHERGGDELTETTPGSIVYQRVLVALKVGEKVGEMTLKPVDAGDLAHVLTLGPAIKASEFASAHCPATVPEAPLRAIYSINRMVGMRRASAKAARGL